MQRSSRPAKRNPINGFPKVADKLASDPDRTTTIFRRFDRLACRNLLFLEAKLAELEGLQDQADEEDLIAADYITIKCHGDWREFEKHATERAADGTPAYPKQAGRVELALQIKETLKEYHEALEIHQVLLNSKAPASTTVSAMRNWFVGGKKGSVERRPQLWGNSAKMFDDPNDLVALRVPADQDRLSDFILSHFGGSFKTEASDEDSAYISEQSLATCVAIVSSVLSAVLLFGSITSLYFVHNPHAILGMLGGWTVLFAISVGWLTNAKRDAIFAATAAYCAVLVVFIRGNLGGSQLSTNVALGAWNCTKV